MSITELTEELNFQDPRTTKRWLEKSNIPIHKKGRELTVFRFPVELILQLDLVHDLMKMFPVKWAEIYELKMEDKRMMNAVFAICPPSKARKKKQNNNVEKYIK